MFHGSVGLQRRIPTVVSLLFLLAAGFFSKFYEGPAQDWANDSLAGMFYVVFWCVFASLFLTRAKTYKITATVFVVTCLLECLQLWNPPVLERLRETFIGRALLGTSFVWSDFPYYLIGSVVGGIWITYLRRVEDRSSR